MSSKKKISIAPPTIDFRGDSDVISTDEEKGALASLIIVFFAKRYDMHSWPGSIALGGTRATAYWDAEGAEPMGEWELVRTSGELALDAYRVLSDELSEREPKTATRPR